MEYVASTMFVVLVFCLFVFGVNVKVDNKEYKIKIEFNEEKDK